MRASCKGASRDGTTGWLTSWVALVENVRPGFCCPGRSRCVLSPGSLDGSDLDLFVAEPSFSGVDSVLRGLHFKLAYTSRSSSYAGPFKWRLHRYQGPPPGRLGIDVIRVSADCLDTSGCIWPRQLAASFDLSGCAVTYDGRTTVIPAPEDTLGFRHLLRQPFVGAFKRLIRIPHGMSKTTCLSIAHLLDGSPMDPVPRFESRADCRNRSTGASIDPHSRERRLVLNVSWALYMLRKVIERIIKYHHRGFAIIGAPFHHGVILIDISMRISELFRSKMYHRCAGFAMHPLAQLYWLRSIRLRSSYLHHYIVELLCCSDILVFRAP